MPGVRTMKKAIIFTLIVVSFVSFSLLYLVRPPIPGEWKELKKGDSLHLVKSKVPELKRYDETMFFADRKVEHFGITFSWNMYVHFDLNEKLVSMNGRSRNDWTGLFDSSFQF
jgi:hypothetical protein